MKRSDLIRLRSMIERASVSLSDNDALESVELFPAWKPNTSYSFKQRIRYEDKLYRVEQDHTSQDGWQPPLVPALFTEIAKPSEIPVWKQPTGAQDAYMTGDKVHYPTADDAIYVSTVDSNVWKPDEYGWELDV